MISCLECKNLDISENNIDGHTFRIFTCRKEMKVVYRSLDTPVENGIPKIPKCTYFDSKNTYH